MKFSDIKRFEVVVGGPGEVRYSMTKAGTLSVYVGKGVKRAPKRAQSVTIQPGCTKFIIEKAK
jgi:hypothetical protein